MASKTQGENFNLAAKGVTERINILYQDKIPALVSYSITDIIIIV
jgi:hypothetical protein